MPVGKVIEAHEQNSDNLIADLSKKWAKIFNWNPELPQISLNNEMSIDKNSQKNLR